MRKRKPPKAYKNIDFLRSREARTVRILCEYLEPEKRFEEHGIKHTIVFFGSSRIKPSRDKDSHYYWAAEELAFQLAAWSKEIEKSGMGFYICSGGGPGIMEAANRGARRAKAKTIGLNISLPYEQYPNKYISRELGFEFHYFFMRKLWFLYQAKALIVFPGGYGTLDELFEILTLLQTEKLEKTNLPVLLYDREYWYNLINFDALVDRGFISPHDISLMKFFSTPEEGVHIIKGELKRLIRTVDNLLKQ